MVPSDQLQNTAEKKTSELVLLPNWVGKRWAVRRGHSYKGKGNAVWGQGTAENGVLSPATLLLPDTVESGCMLATMGPSLMFFFLILFGVCGSLSL